MTEVTKTFRRTTYPTIDPTRPSNSQSGRTILVTGASEGIALGIAQAFAVASAKRIILVSRTQSKLDDAAASVRGQNKSVDVETIRCDVSNIDQLRALWETLRNEGTFIDTLVASASGTLSPKDLDEQVGMIHFNMIAYLHLFELFRTQPNPESKSKRLIYMSSATIHCYPYQAVTYAATKAGFSTYLCHMADFIPEDEMRIIIYHPGSVYTAAADRASEVPKDLPIWDDHSLSAHTALWLASSEAAFLHGRYVWSNWDVDELMEMKEKVLTDPGLFKIGITGLESFNVPKLMDVCKRFPRPD